jgi:hypothetical protein
MPRRQRKKNAKAQESKAVPFVVANSAEFDVLVNAPGDLNRKDRYEVKRAWEHGSLVSELKARLKEMNIQWKKNAKKADLVALLILHHVPLGGGPIVWLPEDDDSEPQPPAEVQEQPALVPSDNEDSDDGAWNDPPGDEWEEWNDESDQHEEPAQRKFDKLVVQVERNSKNQAETQDTLNKVLRIVTNLSEQGKKRPSSPKSASNGRPLRKQRRVVFDDQDHIFGDREQSQEKSRDGKHSDFGFIRVNAQIRACFESASYVDLRSLREVSVAEDDFVELGSGVRLQVNGQSSKAPIASISEWTLLFTRLIQGVAEFHPSMVRMMYEHMAYINGAAHREAYPVQRLIDYSRALRRRFQGPTADWSNHDVGIMGMYLQQQSKALPSPRAAFVSPKSRRSSAKPARSKAPKYCYDWEFGRTCKFGDKCKFVHACIRCEGGSSAHKNANCPNPMSGNV